jgi:hypothetical protein
MSEHLREMISLTHSLFSLYAHTKYFVVDINDYIIWTVLEHVASSIPVHLASLDVFFRIPQFYLMVSSNFLFYEHDWS